MNKKTFKDHLIKMTVAGMGILSLTACNGIFDDIYDQPEETIVPVKGQLVIDATSWSDWYYVDLDQLHQLTVEGDEAALLKAQTEFQAYPIPMEATGDRIEASSASTSSLSAANAPSSKAAAVSSSAADAPSSKAAAVSSSAADAFSSKADASPANASSKAGSSSTQNEKAGQYMYWFDVFGAGVKKNEFRYFTPTAEQTAPAKWTFAVHRNNVRTNGGAVLETSYTSMDQLPETSEPFHNQKFTEDEWSENEVWDDQEQMLLCLVPSQGIAINKVLSSWLSMEIPPMPPSFSLNNHVFILRLKDGSYAALQLQNYLSPKGAKCYLTINYKYPY